MADAPKLLGTDTLRKAYPKFNQAIDNANEALGTANTAKSTADTAKSTADTALANSESTQTQLNAVVIDGDSSPQIAQALADTPYTTLKEKHDAVDAQLADITEQEIQLLDAFDTKPVGYPVNIDYIRSRQLVLLAQFYQKLRKNEVVTIDCNGDSITYGFDNVSADKRAPVNGSLDNRASKTYPEALQENLNIVYPNIVTVRNNGFPGDGAQAGYTRTKDITGAQLSLLMYGINDAMSAGVSYKGNIEEYIKWYEQLIIRTILKGSAVILLTPTKLKDWGNLSVDSFKNALYHLCEKYGIDLIETDEFMQNYNSDTIFSDDTHYNGTGYRILGSRLTGIIVGRGVQNPLYVKDGDSLLTRPNLDNCIRNNCVYLQASADTPPEIGVNGVQTRINPTGNVVYSFYTAEDNLVLIPNLYVGAATQTKIELDFGILQQDFTFDKSVNKAPSITNNPVNVLNFNNLNTDVNKDYAVTNGQYIHIPKRGWHTVTVSAVADNSFLNGIEFMNYNSMFSWQKLKNKGSLHTDLYSSWSATPASITQSTVPMSRISDLIGYDYSLINANSFKNSPLKLTVYTELQSILEYIFIPAKAASSTKFLTLARRTNIAATPTERTCIDVYVSEDLANLVITWGGTTNKLSAFNISVL